MPITTMPRPISSELVTLRLLNARMDLSEHDKWNYARLEKGLEGELKFDLLTDGLVNNGIVIKGLLLEVNDSEFQIDTTLIFEGIIHLFDVKNYENDYYYENGKLYSKNGNILTDPLLQRERCESLFLRLLKNLGFNYRVESRLVFINPEFTLMQAPRDYPIIYPTQVNRLMKQLNEIPSRLTKMHENLARKLISLHKPVSSNMKLPAYEFGQLKKMIMCKLCYSLSTTVEGNFIVCKTCGHKELVDAAVLRSVRELIILFPGIRITTSLVYEWCGRVIHKKRISRILRRNYTRYGHGKYSYYQ
ncbi:nuclease-related domain-containing protein [Neobacillus mesonae]|uniref:nuclease-related domain-containing protein n=1 Tax=Neobacillus mesonae TaxID=1193713 RepID=UPI0025740762|nr:nuclease-related domain-containing protein [Neobacillus mesonae]MED4206048.1 nuclease-related domain-containing protein [Neobacillus mesonae]